MVLGKIAMLSKARIHQSKHLMPGVILSTAVVLISQSSEEEKSSTADEESTRRVNFSGLPSFTAFTPVTTSCAMLGNRFNFSLTRSQTIRKMEATSNKRKLRSRYDVQWKSPIGEGGFGAVFLAIDKETKETVAVKKISKEFTNDASFQKEMNALLHIRQFGGHPYICGLRENFDEGDHYYLVLDLVSGGEVFDHLINNGAYSEADAARLLREVGSAIAFLHGTQIVHGDLKPENLMLSSENSMLAAIKVVDFGCAQIIDKASPFYEESKGIDVTTPGYAPPELIMKNSKLKNLAPAMDMFAIGVILYVMLCGCHPFDLNGDATDDEINRNVLSRKGPPLRNSPITAHLSDSAIDLIEKLIHPNPKKRFTAQQLLEHPWVRGETARTRKMEGSHERLSAYKRYKSRLEATVFQNLVELSGDANDNDISKRTSLIERSFQMLDPDCKGYISTKDLQKLDPSSSGDEVTEDDSQLSLSGYSDLLSENMKNRYFASGKIIYREGDVGDKMYFINSGRVEVSTKDGFRTNIEAGDFFGEGALLAGNGKHSSTIKCVTPVHAIEISKEYFQKYLADGHDAHLSLSQKHSIRKQSRAKNILASTKNMEDRVYGKGEYFYKQGEPGDDVFILESGDVAVTVNDHVVFPMKPGELCGEHAAVFGKPRNTSARCVSRECVAHKMTAKDFHKIVSASKVLKEGLREICLRREFQKALVFATKKPFPTKESELRAAFDAVDNDRSGEIDSSEICEMLKNMDNTLTKDDIKDMMQTLDLDGSGSVSWEEFKRLFGMAGAK